MANNLMYLMHEATGQCVLLAKHFAGPWGMFKSDGDPILMASEIAPTTDAS